MHQQVMIIGGLGLTGWANYENGYNMNGSRQKPHNHGNTSSSKNFMPYYTCYIFRRTK